MNPMNNMNINNNLSTKQTNKYNTNPMNILIPSKDNNNNGNKQNY